MRAAQSQSLLATVRRLPSAEARAILDRIPPAAIDAISGTLPVGWVSMTHHMALALAIRAELHRERNIALWRDAMLHAFERPFLHGFVRMTTSLLGVRPSSLLSRGNSIYEHVTRKLGVLRYEPRGDTSGEIELQGFPSDRYDFVCYAEGMTGCVDATIAICDAKGRVDEISRDEAEGTLRLRVAWD